MKKIILTTLALSGVFASSAFAQSSINAATSIGGGAYTPSTKVGISITSGSNSYAAASCHVNGTFQYGTGGGSAFTGDASKILQATIPTQATDAVYCSPTGQTSATAMTGTW